MAINKKVITIFFFAIVIVAAIASVSYFNLPVNKVHIKSELVMLGDFDGNHTWDAADETILRKIFKNPFSFSRLDLNKADVNRNNLIDEEDIAVLTHLYRYHDPYDAEKKAVDAGRTFPRPREMFRYIPATEYVVQPLFALKHGIAKNSPLTFLSSLNTGNNTYQNRLLTEIYNEGLRFSLAYDARKNTLTGIEKRYASEKIEHCNNLYRKRDYYNILLNLITLVEDAETLTTKGQSEFVAKLLYFRDDLRSLLTSPHYQAFVNGSISYDKVLDRISELLDRDLAIKLDVKSLSPPRDFFKLENYADRAEWQYYKSRNRKADFEKLVLYAQYDTRYLRSAAATSRKHQDPQLMNHNLPMVLLFREALHITGGDKKAAVGLLDEAIRIPFGWIKSIPHDKLPKSLAMEHFLLPGNKEDGLDKSRHWNVFGGISLYKSPEESLVTALKREMNDLKEDGYSTNAMTEFLRDTIANINGIYHIVSIDPRLPY